MAEFPRAPDVRSFVIEQNGPQPDSNSETLDAKRRSSRCHLVRRRQTRLIKLSSAPHRFERLHSNWMVRSYRCIDRLLSRRWLSCGRKNVALPVDMVTGLSLIDSNRPCSNVKRLIDAKESKRVRSMRVPMLSIRRKPASFSFKRKASTRRSTFLSDHEGASLSGGRAAFRCVD